MKRRFKKIFLKCRKKLSMDDGDDLDDKGGDYWEGEIDSLDDRTDEEEDS